MSTNDALLREITAFLKRTGMSPTAFGVAAVNDGHLLRNIKAGRSIGSKMIDRIREFIAAHNSEVTEGNVPRRRANHRGATPVAA